MNRTYSLLVIGILLVGIIILAVLLSQKTSEANDFKTQLSGSRQTATLLQTQLTQCQQNVATLQAQLSQSQQSAASLQTQLTACQQNLGKCQNDLNAYTSKPLIPSAPVVVNGDLPGYHVVSVPIVLRAFEQVQGEIMATSITPVAMYIQDPSGKTVQDLGQIMQSNFMFTAEMDGKYNIVIRNPYGELRSYRLTYTVYQRQ
jgi:hypothetical protein